MLSFKKKIINNNKIKNLKINLNKMILKKVQVINIKFLKNYIDVEIDTKKISKTINSCAFDNLANMEKKFGFQEAAYSQKDKKKINFFNLGKKNDWKNLLNPEIEKKIRIEFNKEMKELNYI